MALYDVMKKQADKTLTIVFEEVFSDKRKFDITDGVIVGLFENMVNHCNSISVLIKEDHPESLDSILRTLFENYVYLTFILKEDTQKRATSYLYSGYIDQYLLIELLNEQSKTGESIRAFFGPRWKEILSEYENRGIKKEDLEEMYLKKLGMKRFEQKWYNLYPELSLKTYKKLCIYCGMEADYHLVYNILSREVHGKDALNRLELKKDFVGIKMTKYNDTLLHENMVKLLLLESTRRVLSYYGLKRQLREFNNLVEWNVKVAKRRFRL